MKTKILIAVVTALVVGSAMASDKLVTHSVWYPAEATKDCGLEQINKGSVVFWQARCSESESLAFQIELPLGSTVEDYVKVSFLDKENRIQQMPVVLNSIVRTNVVDSISTEELLFFTGYLSFFSYPIIGLEWIVHQPKKDD